MEHIIKSELTRQILKRAISLQKKKYRNIESAILIEGLLPLEEAVKSHYIIKEVYYTVFLLDKPGVKELLIELQAKDQTSCYEISGSELKQISTEVNPQGILAVAAQRDYNEMDLKGNILVLDQLQDPGNVGTLFRIAHWFGLGGVILMKGSVDVHNPKVIRSSMGSFFHMPFIYVEALPEVLLKERSLLLSKAHSDVDIKNMNMQEIAPFLLVIGNEARGIDHMFDDLQHQDITLPPLGGAESLNAAVAAAAILSKLLY
jgi:TrmH family RNA methyltransferase